MVKKDTAVTKAKKKSSKTPAKRSPRKKQAPKITAETYNKLWDSWCRLQNMRAAAREAGVDYNTAVRYITGPGSPEHGMVPIRDRWLRVQARAQQEQELDLLTFRRREQKNAMNNLTIVHGEMQLAFADVKRRLDAFNKNKGKVPPEREMGIRDLVTSYDKAARLVEHLLGGADVTVDNISGRKDPLDSLTDEEALEYATTGRLPGDVQRFIQETEDEDQ